MRCVECMKDCTAEESIDAAILVVLHPNTLPDYSCHKRCNRGDPESIIYQRNYDKMASDDEFHYFALQALGYALMRGKRGPRRRGTRGED